MNKIKYLLLSAFLGLIYTNCQESLEKRGMKRSYTNERKHNFKGTWNTIKKWIPSILLFSNIQCGEALDSKVSYNEPTDTISSNQNYPNHFSFPPKLRDSISLDISITKDICKSNGCLDGLEVYSTKGINVEGDQYIRYQFKEANKDGSCNIKSLLTRQLQCIQSDYPRIIYRGCIDNIRYNYLSACRNKISNISNPIEINIDTNKCSSSTIELIFIAKKKFAMKGEFAFDLLGDNDCTQCIVSNGFMCPDRNTFSRRRLTNGSSSSSSSGSSLSSSSSSSSSSESSEESFGEELQEAFNTETEWEAVLLFSTMVFFVSGLVLIFIGAVLWWLFKWQNRQNKSNYVNVDEVEEELEGTNEKSAEAV